MGDMGGDSEFEDFRDLGEPEDMRGQGEFEDLVGSGALGDTRVSWDLWGRGRTRVCPARAR